MAVKPARKTAMCNWNNAFFIGAKDIVKQKDPPCNGGSLIIKKR
jgi:hypothetical protein